MDEATREALQALRAEYEESRKELARQLTAEQIATLESIIERSLPRPRGPGEAGPG